MTQQVMELAAPVVQAAGCSLWDVEYVREGGEWFLRLYIDRPGGLVGIDDCETISRAMDPILDESDPIPTGYTFEVCSAGAERALKRPGDFAAFVGSQVLVKLYGPIDGSKEYVGTLLGRAEDGTVTIRDARDAERSFQGPQLALVRLYVTV